MKYESSLAVYSSDYLEHYGIKGMKWGIRRYQNYDGTLTPAGKKRQAKLYTQELNERNKETSGVVADAMKKYSSASRTVKRNSAKGVEKMIDAAKLAETASKMSQAEKDRVQEILGEGYQVKMKTVYRNMELGQQFAQVALAGAPGSILINAVRSKNYSEFGGQAPWAVRGYKYKVEPVSDRS